MAHESPTLEALAQVLGGVIRQANGQTWLDTRVDGLTALVVRTAALRYDLVVLTPVDHPAHAQKRLVDVRSAEHWVLADRTIPRLREGWVFLGCRGGVLVAHALGLQPIEAIVGTLSELAVHAQLGWAPPEWEHQEVEREPWRDRIGFALLVALVVALLRR